MSAICASALSDEESRLTVSPTPPDGLTQWPYYVGWQNQDVIVGMTISGEWTGSFQGNGFSMSTTYPGQGGDGTTDFSFDYTEASPGSSWAPITQIADDGGETYFAVYLALTLGDAA